MVSYLCPGIHWIANPLVWSFVDVGRAKPILFCSQDAGVKYELDLIPLDWSTWPGCKADLIAKGYPIDTLPVMELEGRQYSQIHPILR
jgi:hypothetical protein